MNPFAKRAIPSFDSLDGQFCSITHGVYTFDAKSTDIQRLAIRVGWACKRHVLNFNRLVVRNDLPWMIESSEQHSDTIANPMAPQNVEHTCCDWI